jgi:cation diffusion facilitator CzcD-associated flavoprotein CzcO
MQFVDVLARAQAKTKMMQSDAPLVEPRRGMLSRNAADQNAGASADAVEQVRTVVLDLHAERFVQLPVIERPSARDAAHRQLNMRNAVSDRSVFVSDINNTRLRGDPFCLLRVIRAS